MSNPRPVITMQIPLPWLLAALGTILAGGIVLSWTASARNSDISNKLDLVVYQTGEMRNGQVADHADLTALKSRTQALESTVTSNNQVTTIRLDNIERASGLKLPIRK